MEKQTVSEELEKYGYVFSMKKTVCLCLGMAGILFLLGRLFMLSITSQVILCMITFMLFPFFIRNAWKNKYYQKQFSDLNIYMEQFLYSFQKTGKIPETLEEISTLFEKGEMKKLIQQAVYFIFHTYDEEAVEEQALEMIEQNYGYDGLKTMHHFALLVEKDGGDYENGICLLLESRKLWANRCCLLLKEKKKKRKDIMLSVLTSLGLCALMYLLAGKLELNVAQQTLSQVVTVLVLGTDLYIFYKADKKLAQNPVKTTHANKNDWEKAWQRMRQYRFLPWDRLGKRIVKRKLEREIEKEFPDWLMEISLLLQSENVQVAIFRSYGDAPAILKPEIEKLIQGIKEKPTALEPYVHFLDEFTLPEIRSAMKMLYSLSEGRGGDGKSQLAEIMQMNQKLRDQAEKMQNEDCLAGMYGLFLAPQLTGGLKLVTDMMLIFVLYMAQIGKIH